MNQKYEKLKTLSQELFQLDQPDLDFGLYPRHARQERRGIAVPLENRDRRENTRKYENRENRKIGTDTMKIQNRNRHYYRDNS